MPDRSRSSCASCLRRARSRASRGPRSAHGIHNGAKLDETAGTDPLFDRSGRLEDEAVTVNPVRDDLGEATRTIVMDRLIAEARAEQERARAAKRNRLLRLAEKSSRVQLTASQFAGKHFLVGLATGPRFEDGA